MNEHMTYGEMVDFIRSHPFVAVSHILFDDCEYLYLGCDGKVYDESGYLFEDWDWSTNRWNGIRAREHGPWSNGWFVKADLMFGFPK